MAVSYWERLEALIASSPIVLDRPKGSAHPRFPELIYPLDYGYLKGTSGGDGNEIDVWRGSLAESRLDAVVCTVDGKKRDAEVKILLGCTAEEKRIVCDFHSGDWMSAVLVERDGD